MNSTSIAFALSVLDDDMAPRPTLTGISVCSGVGMLDVGIELAAELLGWSYQPILYVEREAFSASNLAQAMEDGILGAAPVWSDLRSVGGPVCRRAVRAALGDDPLGILHGGIPCQPWSSAGRRAGSQDPRDLWPAAARAIRRYRPRIIFVENVEAMLSAPGGAERILGQLEGMGYTTAAAVLSSRAMGANHQRRRLWIMGVMGWGDRGDQPTTGVHAGRRGEGPGTSDRGGAGKGVAGHRGGGGDEGECDEHQGKPDASGVRDGLAHHDGEPDERRGDSRELPGTAGPPPGSRDQRQRRRDAADDCEQGVAHGDDQHQDRRVRDSGLETCGRGRTMGDCHGSRSRALVARYAPAGDDWTAWGAVARTRPDLLPAGNQAAIESEVCRVADGVASRVDRLRAIGNGVDPVAACCAFLDLYASITGVRADDWEDSLTAMK